MTLPELRLTGVRNRFLRDIDLCVADGELFVIVGPSGAGKTSLLRVIAGLAAHEGSVAVDGEEVQALPPYRRAMGYVSQDLHLFPHLTVEGNLLIAMDRQSLTREQKRNRAMELLNMLRIGHLAGRKTPTLSGGEKQRTALARVLASSPRILLLDEPFSKLDFRTGRYLRSEFKSLQVKLNLTTILVTHNIEEARELADTLAVMRSGALAGTGSPSRMMDMNQNHDDSFLETQNILTCNCPRPLGNGLIEMEWAGGLSSGPGRRPGLHPRGHQLQRYRYRAEPAARSADQPLQGSHSTGGKRRGLGRAVPGSPRRNPAG